MKQNVVLNNVVLNNLFRDYNIQNFPVPDYIELMPWMNRVGVRFHQLTLMRWSDRDGLKYIPLPTKKQVVTDEINVPEDVAYWDANILNSLDPGIYILKEEERRGIWECSPNKWYYRTWIFEVVR